MGEIVEGDYAWALKQFADSVDFLAQGVHRDAEILRPSGLDEGYAFGGFVSKDELCEDVVFFWPDCFACFGGLGGNIDVAYRWKRVALVCRARPCLKLDCEFGRIYAFVLVADVQTAHFRIDFEFADWRLEQGQIRLDLRV